MIRYFGIDVHKKTAHVSMLDSTGSPMKQFTLQVERESLEMFGRALTQEDKVVLEATTNTWAVYRIISKYTPDVTISNPLRTKAIAQAKIKTDKVDSFVLAKLLHAGFIPSVWVPDETTLKLRRLVSNHESLVRRRTKTKNRIHSVLHQNLIQHPYTNLFGKSGMAWLKQTLETLPEFDRQQIECELRLLSHIEKELECDKKHLAKESYPDERVRLLMTIPGVDFTVALCLISAIGDVSRFPEPDKLASYVGVVPRVRQSANHCYTGRITKQGRSLARWMIIEAAQHVSRGYGPLSNFYRRIKKKKGHNVAVVAVARKLLVIVWHMLTKSEPYRYAMPRSLNEKLFKLRRLATGIKKKTGPKPGTPPSENRKTGKRVKFSKTLKMVLQEANLPSPAPVSNGELRYLSRIHYPVERLTN